MNGFTSIVKRTIHKSANIFGFDIIKIGHFDHSLGSHLLKVFKSREIDCVLDVGANLGQYGKFLREIGYTGYILSFEPVKAVYEQLVMASENDPKWNCFNLALSDESQSKIINVYQGSQFCSFLDISDYAKNVWDDVGSATKEIVNTVRLDEIFDELKNSTQCSNFYLKLDTQGYDLNVFHGAKESLQHVKAMQSELSLISVYNDMHPTYSSLSEYNKSGFYISGMFPITIEKELAVIEYDCVLVKRTA